MKEFYDWVPWFRELSNTIAENEEAFLVERAKRVAWKEDGSNPATLLPGDGRTLHVRKATRAEPPQHAIYDALGVDPEPGGIRKTIV